jgi:hypothetical protein
MKPNDPHHWTVALYGEAGTDAESVTAYVGDIEGALSCADEQESEVEFEVARFVITRGAKVKTANR